MEPCENRIEHPDLTMEISEARYNNKYMLTFALQTRDASLKPNHKKFNSPPFEVDPQKFFRGFFQDIDGLKSDGALTPRVMAEKGADLFEKLVPEKLMAMLWSMRKSVRSLLIISEEPWIPWELCKLQTKDENGKVAEGPFLCEAFALTRWTPNVDRILILTLDHLAVVAPAGILASTSSERRGIAVKTVKDPKIPYTSFERDYVMSLSERGVETKEIKPRHKDVVNALSLGRYDGWHFAGHGVFGEADPERSVIRLDFREKLTVEAISGKTKNLGKANPLVFLNACHAGRGAFSLTGIGGWANRFVKNGAGASIGKG